MHGSTNLAKLLANQKSPLDTLFIWRQDDLELDLHPDLKIRRLFVNSYTLNICCQFKDVECLYFWGNLCTQDFQKFLHHFSSLKALTIDELPTSADAYHTESANVHLTELIMDGKTRPTQLFGAFKVFPNLKKVSIFVKHLDFSGSTLEDIGSFGEKLNKLESFTVGLSPGEGFTNIKQLQNVTHLYIMAECGPMDYMSLKDACRNLTFLSIQDCIEPQGFNKKLDFGRIFEMFPELSTLQLDKNMFGPSVMRIIKDKGKNLKSLKLKDASKEYLMTLYEEGRSLNIEGLAITSFNDNKEFEIVKKGVFKLD